MTQFPHDRPVRLAPSVQRLTAPNPGIMTGPGTNTYLIGQQELAVIDPGPNNEAHLERILNIAKDMKARIRWILCTHTHLDHSPGAAPLKQTCGATVIGQSAADASRQDASFLPDQIWHDGDRLDSDEFTLIGVHTPGHASNHLCFYYEAAQMLFTGDHLMEGSTVVIAPPDGNMTAYLASLEKLKTLSLTQWTLTHLAPAHGNLIEHPIAVIDAVIQHRLKREAKVMSCLERLGSSTLTDLTSAVYDDAPAFLHPIARFSLLAHLDKLQEEGRAQHHDSIWQATT